MGGEMMENENNYKTIPHHGRSIKEFKPTIVDIGTDFFAFKCRRCKDSFMEVRMLWFDTKSSKSSHEGLRLVLGVKCPKCGYADALKPYLMRTKKILDFDTGKFPGREWRPPKVR